MKHLCAVGLLLVSSAASAVPVNAIGGVTNWDLFWSAQTDATPTYGEDFIFGEFGGSSRSIGFTQSVGTEGARASVSSAASYDTSILGNDDFLAFTLSITLAVNVSVDPSLTDGRAYAYARTRSALASFNVLESVLYQGPHTLTGAGGSYAAGSIFAPGSYSFDRWDRLTATATAVAGESLSISRTHDFEYVFAKVPVPATLPLFAAGLLSVAWVRKRRPNTADKSL